MDTTTQNPSNDIWAELASATPAATAPTSKWSRKGLVIGVVGGVVAIGVGVGAVVALGHGPSPVVAQVASTRSAESPVSAPAAVAPTATAPAAPTYTVGQTLTADAVAAARAAGQHVYVSPNGDGAGLIVDPAAPLPEQVISDIHAASPAAIPVNAADLSARMRGIQAIEKQITDAGLSAFVVLHTPAKVSGASVSGSAYGVDAFNVPGSREWGATHTSSARATSPEQAIAAIQALIDANPTVPVVNLP